MASLGNLQADGYVSNRVNDAAGAKPVIRPPSPGRPSVFQKAWEDHRNGTSHTFPVTLKIEDVIQGYTVLLRDLPDIDPPSRRRTAMSNAEEFEADYYDDDEYGDNAGYYADDGDLVG